MKKILMFAVLLVSTSSFARSEISVVGPSKVRANPNAKNMNSCPLIMTDKNYSYCLTLLDGERAAEDVLVKAAGKQLFVWGVWNYKNSGNLHFTAISIFEIVDTQFTSVRRAHYQSKLNLETE